MDEKLGTELVSKNALSLINDNECISQNFSSVGVGMKEILETLKVVSHHKMVNFAL